MLYLYCYDFFFFPILPLAQFFKKKKKKKKFSLFLCFSDFSFTFPNLFIFSLELSRSKINKDIDKGSKIVVVEIGEGAKI